MWIMIYWVCTNLAAPCVTNNIAAFSTEEMCQQAASRLEEKSETLYNERVSVVCVNSDISYFE